MYLQRAYVLATTTELCMENPDLRRALHRVPLMRTLRNDNSVALPDTPHVFATKTKTKGIAKIRKSKTSTSNHRNHSTRDIEKVVLQHRNLTVVTPAVMSTAEALFRQQMSLEGTSLKQEWTEHKEHLHESSWPVHKGNPVSIEWDMDSRAAPFHYRAVYVDGVKYSVSFLSC